MPEKELRFPYYGRILKDGKPGEIRLTDGTLHISQEGAEQSVPLQEIKRVTTDWRVTPKGFISAIIVAFVPLFLDTFVLKEHGLWDVVAALAMLGALFLCSVVKLHIMTKSGKGYVVQASIISFKTLMHAEFAIDVAAGLPYMPTKEQALEDQKTNVFFKLKN